MQISELFISLGVKGSDKTISALTQVKTGLGNVASTSLEAKAAIIGAMYALERLMSQSAVRGTELSNFNALTGISVKQLQQWQYAARQAGESNEEFTGSLKSVYDKMAQMKLNKGAPEGLGLLAQTVGFDVKRAYTDTFYVMEQLQKFAHSNVSKDIQNQVLKSFGISENTIAAMRKGVFNQQNFKRAPIYGDSEIDQLSKVNVQWGNLENKIQMLFGHFTAAHGSQLVGDISKVADQVFKMVNAFEKLSEKLHLFQVIANAFNGWSVIFSKISEGIDKFGPKISNLVDSLIIKLGKLEDKFHLLQKIIEVMNYAFQGWGVIFDKIGKTIDNITPSNINTSQENKDNKVLDKVISNMDSDPFAPLKGLFDSFIDHITGKSLYEDNISKKNIQTINNNIPNINNTIIPKIPINNQSSINNQNTSINQNLYFQHEGKEYPKIKDSVQKSVGDAWKQLSAQSQGT